jgi:hypothetical protein
MTHKMTCPGCQATLQLRPEYAGKKIRCPKCQQVLTVPAEGEEEPVELEAVEEDAFTSTRPARETMSPASKKRSRSDEEEEDDDRDEGPHYVPCPRCGARGASRVLWTPWGSFYGPALFTHVRCPHCYCAYNGNTGRSNIVPAILFVTIPLVLLLGILGAVVLMLLPYF